MLSGAYRCLGACLAHHGTVSATLANTADGVGHETVEIDLPDGTICGSDGDLDGAFAVLLPSVGTALSLTYECDDVDGNVLDSGTVDIRRRREGDDDATRRDEQPASPLRRGASDYPPVVRRVGRAAPGDPRGNRDHLPCAQGTARRYGARAGSGDR
jgi:hypothetical protein